jgi:hypothetical protein
MKWDRSDFAFEIPSTSRFYDLDEQQKIGNSSGERARLFEDDETDKKSKKEAEEQQWVAQNPA